MAKLLLVEDDLFLITMYKTRFEHEGYQVVTAQDGETALALVQQEKPNLVLMDIMLPKMGGVSILEEMRKNQETANTPVIVLSNLTDQTLINQAKQLGVKEFLIKANYTPTQIVEVAKKYVT
jgi:two-component system alkaline phosphatase synthesis response regulator PhoP